MRSVVVFLAGAVLGSAVMSSAHAADAILIRDVIPYKDDTVGAGPVRQQCTWNKELSENIVKESKGQVVATDKDLATLSDKRLDIVITYVHAAGGGSVSGPKW